MPRGRAAPARHGVPASCMTLAGTALADAVDTQTEAILIRAMSAGVTVRSVFVRELATGAVLGSLVGITFLVSALATHSS